MEDDQLAAFHCDSAGRLSLKYVPVVLSQNNPLAPPLLINVVDRLMALFPAQRGQLDLLRTNLAWKSIVQPAG